MEALGLDPEDANLNGTPLRVARAYQELFSGLDPANEPEVRTFANTEGYTQVVAITDIRFHSLCAHHFLPLFGTVHVAYVPKDRVVGLSKVVRVVDYFGHRPQLQDALTEQVIDLIDRRLRPAGGMVVVEARHFWMEMRGVSKPGVSTTTRALRRRVRRRKATAVPGPTTEEASMTPFGYSIRRTVHRVVLATGTTR